MEYIDSHAHLPLLTHDSIDAILNRAKRAGVTRLVTVSTEQANWESNKQTAESLAYVYYSLGIHPHQAENWKKCAPFLEAYFTGGIPKKCVAIGETGLDFHYQFSNKDEQLEALRSQLALAKKVGLPVILHCRDAFADLFDSVKRVGTLGVMHCFTGSYEDARVALDLGLKISFSGILTFKNAQSLRQAARQIPLSAILVETDCPFLAPVPYRGKPNEPSYLPMTVRVLADVFGVEEARVAHQTTQNAIELFRL